MVATRASNNIYKKKHINSAPLVKYKKKRMQKVVKIVKMATTEGTAVKVAKVSKTTIPLALRQQVWKTYVGTKFESKCLIRWCTNRITAFEYDVGHNIPESKGGTLDISNLRPICHKCNNSMSNTYTIDEWDKLSRPAGSWCCC